MRIKNGFSAPTKGAVPSQKEAEVAALRERLTREAIRPCKYAPGVNFEVSARVFVRADALGELQADIVTAVRLSTFHRQAKALSVKSACLMLQAAGADDASVLIQETAAKLSNELADVLATYNPSRCEALGRVVMKGTVEEMIEDVRQRGNPLVVGTSSRERKDKTIGYEEFRHAAERGDRQVVLLFGTGWGLTDEVVAMCDRMLEPVKGGGEYNHLSLRVAIGIILDRIFGDRGGCHERSD